MDGRMRSVGLQCLKRRLTFEIFYRPIILFYEILESQGGFISAHSAPSLAG